MTADENPHADGHAEQPVASNGESSAAGDEQEQVSETAKFSKIPDVADSASTGQSFARDPILNSPYEYPALAGYS